MKIYVASSWRNHLQPAVVEICRSFKGVEVYDFKNPASGTGLSWREVAHPGIDWKDWSLGEYLEALQHPRSEQGFASDMNALMACDLCVLVFPAGVSASLEFGYAVGARKRTLVVGMPREADLMVKMAEHYCVDLDDLVLWITRVIQEHRLTKFASESAHGLPAHREVLNGTIVTEAGCD